MIRTLRHRSSGTPSSTFGVTARRLLAAAWIAGSASFAAAQNALTEIPDPDPEAERAAMTLSDGAAMNLYASDPEIRKPIQINFDSEGSLWVASSEVYPQIEPGQVANDKIVVLKDTDGDGKVDRHTVFADGLLIPTGVAPLGTDACYVAEGTRLLLLQDTDGDGKADSRRVVFSGFGTEDTHHLLHTLRWGPDGCLYFNQSIYIHSHIETADGTRRLDGGGIWRYRPVTGELEVFCRGFINPWGHVFDEYGESFVTDGAFFEGINYAFPDAVFVTSPGATRWLKGLNPGSPKHCGLEILSGNHIPDTWRGDVVTNDFRSHRVCRFTVQPSGSGYVSRQQPEIVTTGHVAFRPVDVRMGPDGAIYVADWYNPIIQHGEVDFRDPRRDREHGRVWRVSFPDRPYDRWPDFGDASVNELVTMLESSALAVRQFARESLWRRGEEDPEGVIDAVKAWRDKPGLNDERVATRALELLWIREAFGAPSPEDGQFAVDVAGRPKGTGENESAGEAESDGLGFDLGPTIRPALRSLWRSQRWTGRTVAEAEALRDIVTGFVTNSDPRARLEAVVSNSDLRDTTAARRTIAAASMPADDNLDFALWQALREQRETWIAASIDGRIEWQGREAALAFAIEASGDAGAAEVAIAAVESTDRGIEWTPALIDAVAKTADAGQLGRLAKSAFGSGQSDEPDPDGESGNDAKAGFGGTLGGVLESLVRRTASDGTVPEGIGALLASRVDGAEALSGDPEFAAAVARAAAAWKVSALEPVLEDALTKAPESVRDELVIAIGEMATASSRATIDRLTGHEDPAMRLAAVKSLLRSRPRAAVKPLAALLRDPASAERVGELMTPMLSRRELPGLLASELAGVGMPVDAARSLLRQVRSGGGHDELENAIRAAGGLDDAAWKLTPELSARLLRMAAESGSPERGETIYRRDDLRCIECHAIGPAGGLVGPNLISMGGSSQPDYILESLLEPSAKLKEGYTTRTLLTDDGQIISGIVIGQTNRALRLRLADGTETEIALDTIEEEIEGKSLMPAGSLDALTETELADLVAFLSALGKDPAYTVSTEPRVRELETLVYSPEANRRLNRTSTDTAASDDPALEWRRMTSRVSGEIPMDELDQFRQHRSTPPTSFVRFRVEMPSAGTASIEASPYQVEAWVDGTPTPVWELKSIELDRGTHRIVFAIDRSKSDQPLVVRIGGDGVPVTTGDVADSGVE